MKTYLLYTVIGGVVFYISRKYTNENFYPTRKTVENHFDLSTKRSNAMHFRPDEEVKGGFHGDFNLYAEFPTIEFKKEYYEG